MAINFPNSPTTGSTFTASGATWQWDGTKWVPYSSGQNFVSKTGDSMSGDLTILSPDGNNLILNAAAGMWPGIEMNIPSSGEGAWIGSYIGGSERWEIDLGNGIAEGSGNVGSNFQIARYANNGSFIDDPLLINRSTGLVSFSQHAPVNDSSYNAADTYWVMNQLAGRTNRNRLINGNFLVDMWNGANTITPASSQFICDRWRTGTLSQAGKFSTQNVAISTPGAPLYRGIVFTSLSAYTPVAADTFAILQPIEYTNCADFQWGTSAAQPATLSFWAQASVSGVYSGSIRNNGSTRSYSFTFNITAINTWQYFTILIPGDTAGTWVVAGNTGGMYLTFDLGSGSNYRGPANAWANASYLGVTGAISLVATNASTLRLTNIQFEMGSQATPFDFRSYADEFLLCQRYYQVAQASARGYAAVATGVWFESTINYPWMRAAPTISVLTVGSSGNLSANYPVANSATANGCRWSVNAAAVGDCYALAYTLALNAEL